MKNVEEPTQVFRVVGPKNVSVVVVPFANPTGDPDQLLVCHGLTEEIIHDLSKVEGLFVIAPNSAFSFVGRHADGPDICRELGVKYAVVGSVNRVDPNVEITVKVVDAHGHVHWQDTYQSDWDQLFEVRDEIVWAIVFAVSVTLTPDDEGRLERSFTPNQRAWRYYLRGLGCHRTHERDANLQAIRRFDLALQEEPKYARALAAKSKAHMLFFINAWGDDPKGSLQEAYRVCKLAVDIDPNEAMAYTALSAILLWMRRHEDAISAANWSLQRDPNHAPTYCNLGSINHYAGNHELGLAMMQHAIKLDPNCPPIYLHFAAQCQYSLENYAAAVATLNRRLSKSGSSDVSRVLLAACYGQLGEMDRARDQWQEALTINPAYSLEQKREALPYKDPADFDHVVEGLNLAGLPT